MSPRRSSSSARTGASTRLLAALGLTGLIGGMAVIVATSGGADSGQTTTAAATTPATTTKTTTTTKPRPPVKIVVTGVGAYDPEGDRTENDGQAGLATDGNPATAWKSERYRSTFRKSGVGLVLDAGRPVSASTLVVTTDTPGYTALVQVGNSATGPFTPVSAPQTLMARTVFTLKPRRGRYVMLWITSMPKGGAAAVNEVAVAARA
jgi:hypothetical protein